MRRTHRQSPLHNVECWTGTFFRAAALWEVGTYILVRHHNGIAKKDCLETQVEILERLQMSRDDEEQIMMATIQAGGDRPPAPGVPVGLSSSSAIDDDFEEVADDSSEEEEDLGFMGDYLTGGLPQFGEQGPVPTQDAFSNRYVRIVNVNGIHHRALVTCACQGADQMHADLMYCRLVPATFSRYRTVFTVKVLDDFRLSNLECKVSAYQYFQKLRRMTEPMGPHKTPNLYQELLRMARLWRWLKRRKWSGDGYKSPQSMGPVPGNMATFCAACPQPGINLPEDWKNDENR